MSSGAPASRGHLHFGGQSLAPVRLQRRSARLAADQPLQDFVGHLRRLEHPLVLLGDVLRPAALGQGLVNCLLDGGETVAVNLACGKGASVRQVIDTARAVTGLAIKASDMPRRPGDPPVLVADASLASEVFGWKPLRSDLTTIVADAWKWHQKSFGNVDIYANAGMRK